MKRSRQFMMQALLMGAVSVLLRAVGVSFQVYVVSIVGAQTVGMTALMSGVFGFAVTLALSGIQLGCTRLVSEGIGIGDGLRVRRTLFCAIGYALFFGLLSGGLLFLLAKPIALYGLKHEETQIPLRIMAASLPAMAISACISGYFIAVRRVYKSTIIQISEQLLRILMTVRLFHGTSEVTTSSALKTLATADTLSCISATMGMLALFLLDRYRHTNELPTLPKNSSPSLTGVGKHLLAVTLPVAVSAYARSGLISLEHLLIPIGLEKFGQAKEIALASYGALQSMALPVVLFSSALPAAFANLLVPEVTESHVRGERARICGIIQRVLSLALLFAIGVSGIMLCYSYELGMTLYRSREAAHFIRILAPLIPVMYLDSAVDAMLKGLGQQVSSMGINIIDASLSVLLVWILVPHLGIYGYVITIYVTEIVNAALSILRLLKISHVRIFPGRWVFRPVLAMIGSVAFTRLLLSFTPLAQVGISSPVLQLTCQILLTTALYLTLTVLLGAIRRREIKWIFSLFKGNPTSQQSALSCTK